MYPSKRCERQRSRCTVTSVDKDKIQLIVIKADHYGAGQDIGKLFYKLEKKEQAEKINLDTPLFMAGSGAIGTLGSAPQKLFFTNSLGEDVTVEILIGQDALR